MAIFFLLWLRDGIQTQAIEHQSSASSRDFETSKDLHRSSTHLTTAQHLQSHLHQILKSCLKPVLWTGTGKQQGLVNKMPHCQSGDLDLISGHHWCNMCCWSDNFTSLWAFPEFKDCFCSARQSYGVWNQSKTNLTTYSVLAWNYQTFA